MTKLERTLLVCPTLNPGKMFEVWLDAVTCQKEKPAALLIIDSSSNDGSVEKAKQAEFEVVIIPREEFSHGGTRQWAIDNKLECEYIIFLTQDAILDDGALLAVLSAFDDSKVGAICGRQLPHHNATCIEAHSRLYNYPEVSRTSTIQDTERLGLKVAFLSNSFAAYRRDALQSVGGFPDNVIFGEDMYVATKMLMAGHKIAYAADACVYHSHDYSLWQEMKRYFDMGVFHAREPWIRQELGSAEGEGIKFVLSELKYLMKHAFWRIPEAFLRTILRYTGFRLGLLEKRIPLKLKRLFAMNKGFFKV